MFLNENNYKVRVSDINDKDATQELKNMKEELEEASNYSKHDKLEKENYQKIKERYELETNLLMLKELKRRTSLLSCFASLFYNIGDFKHSEAAYILYTKLIEINYGNESLESSNCYF